MATVSLSPSPLPISAMSTRRVPLSSNPNVANSPLRGAAAALAAAAQATKQRRSHADLQREEAYGQPPPAKRQMLDAAGSRALRSPPLQRSSKVLLRTTAARGYGTEKTASQPAAHKLSEKEADNLRQWQTQIRARLPKMVFYFESVPDEQRVRLAKQVTHLGAREEKFFSIDITHVVTTRPIPSEKTASQQDDGADSNAENQAPAEQPRTIDPSLLNRAADLGLASSTSAKRKLLFDTSNNRRLPVQGPEESLRRPKARNADVLYRAREMGKKIWSLEKLQRIVDLLLEPDPYRSAALGHGSRGAQANVNGPPEESHLLQLLNNERVHGPSDRDPTVASKELNYFKGPYIYVYDIEEKQKPIMVREYAKVADKKDGDWPQFRTASNGRCPFVEDSEVQEKRQNRDRERVSKATVAAAAPALKRPEPQPARPVTGKRTLAEMENAHNRRPSVVVRPTESFDPVQVSNPPNIDFRPQNAFTSRARTGRFFAGEPAASGVQRSNITSAIRSQMVSSTTGGLGPKAGTSKEVHGLQRKVLQRNSIPLTSQEPSSRRTGEMSHDGTTAATPATTYTRSASLGRAVAGGQKLDVIEEGDKRSAAAEKPRRTASVPTASVHQPAKQKKPDPKPGYCENCQDKFEDFDDHIVSRKHRKFAENNENWNQLDDLLGQLKRAPRYELDDDENEW